MRSRRAENTVRVLLTRSAALVIAAVLVNLSTVGANAADPSPPPSSDPGRSIAVSVPPDPVQFKPGETGVVQLRVVNPGTDSVRVKVIGRGLTLGDEGKIAINDGPDPLWGDKADFPTGPIQLGQNGFAYCG